MMSQSFKRNARGLFRTAWMVVFPVGAIVALTYADPGEGSPSAKVTAMVGGINLLTASAEGNQGASPWAMVMENTLHTSSQKDLFIDVSLEVGLYTNTFVADGGNGGNGNGGHGGPSKSTASAAVKVKVLVDGVEALPGEVVFGSRTQTLEANFQGFIADCLIIDPETGEIELDEDCVDPETLSLVLETMHAASFNFLLADPGVGTHTIQVLCQSVITTATDGNDDNTAEASALVGKGSVTVEKVRLAIGDDIEL